MTTFFKVFPKVQLLMVRQRSRRRGSGEGSEGERRGAPGFLNDGWQKVFHSRNDRPWDREKSEQGLSVTTRRNFSFQNLELKKNVLNPCREKGPGRTCDPGERRRSGLLLRRWRRCAIFIFCCRCISSLGILFCFRRPARQRPHRAPAELPHCLHGEHPPRGVAGQVRVRKEG